ncbi:hypothetical protein [Deinococcus peraridilitoris]|uniref:Uncharacterized protein n=1 Tax=Deinococcus peraridilitoris (strain DSM 19664 / LMG 22246 / CIP 109416 / KR-200) TaxID=937777 RepID=L0A3D6_DEIPD|nr:hypothetical protein [Deinococcus peraridilitoris]AFZ67954.1 hypothetical protein Deipe_2482 [Deinococcus peraridilitoris DSM 19664]
MEKTEIHGRAAKLIARQEKQIRELETRLKTLAKTQRRSGGSLRRLMLLSLGGYLLWRNQTVRSKVTGALDNLNPQTQDQLRRVGEAVRGGVDAVKRGERPMDAVKSAAQDVQQTLSKSVSNATSEVRLVAEEVQRDSDRALRDAQEQAHDFSDDVQRRLDEERRKDV